MKTYIIIGIAVLCLTALLVSRKFNVLQRQSVFTMPAIQAYEKVPEEFKKKETWEKRIAAVGAEQAYKDVKTIFAHAHFGEQHTAAHVFGNLLYDAEGTAGIGICDNDFSFGCYHGFFSRAISIEGEGVISKLDGECIKKFGKFGTGCQHGIGHGLLEYFTPRRLVDALNACDATTPTNPLFGCTSGVFMEYNTPTLFDGEITRTEPRTIEPQNPTAPCDSIPEQFRSSCYYEMGQWWGQVLHNDYIRIGMICSKAPIKLQEPCFLGTGKAAAQFTSFDVAATIQACNKMPSADGKLLCRAGASWSFFSFPQYQSEAGKLCESVPHKVSSIRCADEARNLDPSRNHVISN